MFDLKVVIIGGGIAGLAAAMALKRNKNQVVVREKNSIHNNSGMAFMLHSTDFLSAHNFAFPLILPHSTSSFLFLY